MSAKGTTIHLIAAKKPCATCKRTANPTLSVKERQALPSTSFADPKARKYPIRDKKGRPDPRHIGPAIAYIERDLQEKRITRAQHDQFRARAEKAKLELGGSRKRNPVGTPRKAHSTKPSKAFGAQAKARSVDPAEIAKRQQQAAAELQKQAQAVPASKQEASGANPAKQEKASMKKGKKGTSKLRGHRGGKMHGAQAKARQAKSGSRKPKAARKPKRATHAKPKRAAKPKSPVVRETVTVVEETAAPRKASRKGKKSHAKASSKPKAARKATRKPGKTAKAASHSKTTRKTTRTYSGTATIKTKPSRKGSKKRSKNPIGTTGRVVLAAGMVPIGYLIFAVTDRLWATRAAYNPTDSQKPLYGIVAYTAVRMTPSLSRVGIPLGSAVILSVPAFMARKKFPTVTAVLGGLAFGAALKGLCLGGEYVLHNALAADPSTAAEETLMNRLFPEKTKGGFTVGGQVMSYDALPTYTGDPPNRVPDGSTQGPWRKALPQPGTVGTPPSGAVGKCGKCGGVHEVSPKGQSPSERPVESSSGNFVPGSVTEVADGAAGSRRRPLRLVTEQQLIDKYIG